jgi:exodeoxyribonuclease VII small subunit
MPSFEESIKKLETIVDKLEKGDLALEESLQLFEEGVGLSAACKQELDAAEGKVQALVKQRDGSLKPETFLTESRSRNLPGIYILQRMIATQLLGASSS